MVKIKSVAIMLFIKYAILSEVAKNGDIWKKRFFKIEKLDPIAVKLPDNSSVLINVSEFDGPVYCNNCGIDGYFLFQSGNPVSMNAYKCNSCAWIKNREEINNNSTFLIRFQTSKANPETEGYLIASLEVFSKLKGRDFMHVLNKRNPAKRSLIFWMVPSQIRPILGLPEDAEEENDIDDECIDKSDEVNSSGGAANKANLDEKNVGPSSNNTDILVVNSEKDHYLEELDCVDNEVSVSDVKCTSHAEFSKYQEHEPFLVTKKLVDLDDGINIIEQNSNNIWLSFFWLNDDYINSLFEENRFFGGAENLEKKFVFDYIKRLYLEPIKFESYGFYIKFGSYLAQLIVSRNLYINLNLEKLKIEDSYKPVKVDQTQKEIITESLELKIYLDHTHIFTIKLNNLELKHSTDLFSKIIDTNRYYNDDIIELVYPAEHFLIEDKDGKKSYLTEIIVTLKNGGPFMIKNLCCLIYRSLFNIMFFEKGENPLIHDLLLESSTLDSLFMYYEQIEKLKLFKDWVRKIRIIYIDSNNGDQSSMSYFQDIKELLGSTDFNSYQNLALSSIMNGLLVYSKITFNIDILILTDFQADIKNLTSILNKKNKIFGNMGTLEFKLEIQNKGKRYKLFNYKLKLYRSATFFQNFYDCLRELFKEVEKKYGFCVLKIRSEAHVYDHQVDVSKKRKIEETFE